MRRWVPVLLLTCVPAFAGDEDKKVVVQAAPDETVSLAKQDMDSFRKQGAVSDPAKLSLLQTPELSTGVPIVAPSTSPEQTLRDQAKKNSNWLVDGVMGTKHNPNDPHALLDPKDPRTRASDRAEILKEAMAGPREGSKSEDSQDRLMTDSPRDVKMEQAAAEARLAETKTVNPLDSYMAAWMSPKDMEILKPALDGRANGTGTSPESVPELEAVAAAHSDRALPAPLVEKPGDNPFLDLLNSPGLQPAPEPVFKPAPAPAADTTPVPTLVPDSKGVIPDFAKPMNEDPAFKGMKRF